MDTKQFQIRGYQHQDYQVIKNLLKEASLFDSAWDSSDNLESIVAKDPQAILVATTGNQVVGLVKIIPYGSKVAYLFRLTVKKSERSQGVGTALIKAAEKIVKDRGATEIGLYVNTKDQSLQDFYKKRDYKTAKKPLKYYYMWKAL